MKSHHRVAAITHIYPAGAQRAPLETGLNADGATFERDSRLKPYVLHTCSTCSTCVARVLLASGFQMREAGPQKCGVP